jgi:predicted dehydrogenase
MGIAMNKLRVGVVGVGYLGKFHAEKFAQMADVELVGVVDIDPAKVRSVAKMFHTQPYCDYRELLGRVDAVSIVVPTTRHFDVSREFLNRGIDVLIEKPITTTIDEADELIRMASSTNALIQVGHLERFNPVLKVLDNFRETPIFIESRRLSRYNPRGTDVSVVLDLMIHDIDIILNRVKSKIVHMQASGSTIVSKHTDLAMARFEFENGCIAHVTANRIDVDNERIMKLLMGRTHVILDFANHASTIITRANGGGKGSAADVAIQKQTSQTSDALALELRSFVQSIKTRQDPAVTGAMGRDALEIALDVVERIKHENISRHAKECRAEKYCDHSG